MLQHLKSEGKCPLINTSYTAVQQRSVKRSDAGTELLAEIVASLACGSLWKLLFKLPWTTLIQAALAECSVKTFSPHQRSGFPLFFVYSLDLWMSHLSASFLCFQGEVWHPWAGGGFPARLWAEGTVRAGCGERGMQKVTFLRNGRNTGLCWKTTACTGISMRRWV